MAVVVGVVSAFVAYVVLALLLGVLGAGIGIVEYLVLLAAVVLIGVMAGRRFAHRQAAP